MYGHDLVVRKFRANEVLPWDLLLLADPERAVVEQYIGDGLIYVAELEDDVIGVYVLCQQGDSALELKNVSVDKGYQGRGFGKRLVLDAVAQAKALGASSLHLGTGNSSFLQLALYQKCGFRIVGVDRDFFVRNYQNPIYENGIQCRDMILLSMNFN